MPNNLRRPSLGGSCILLIFIFAVSGCGSNTAAVVVSPTVPPATNVPTAVPSPTVAPTIVPTVDNNTPVPVDVSGKPVGVDADTRALAANGGLTGGDADTGALKYTSLGCAACHTHGQTGPATVSTYARIINDRLPNNPGRWASPEEYIAESIVHPNAFVVPSFNPGIMPQDWGTKLDLQDLKDLIAFLETQK